MTKEAQAVHLEQRWKGHGLLVAVLEQLALDSPPCGQGASLSHCLFLLVCAPELQNIFSTDSNCQGLIELTAY